jgi:hypothetical protein
MHRNPVKRGLVSSPEEIHSVILSKAKDLGNWLSTRSSSCRFCLLDKAGPVRVNVGWTEISCQAPAA